MAISELGAMNKTVQIQISHKKGTEMYGEVFTRPIRYTREEPIVTKYCIVSWH
jgi:hypothetical protein